MNPLQNLRAIFEKRSNGPVPSTGWSTSVAPIPLLHAAALFASGIALTHWIDLRPIALLLASVTLATLAVLAGFKAQRVAWLPLALLWFSLGSWCALMQPAPSTSRTLAPLANGLLRTVEGTVLDAPPLRSEVDDSAPGTAQPQLPSQRIDLDLTSAEVVTDTDGRQEPVSGRIRVSVRWPQGAPVAFHCGDRIHADLRMLSQPGYRDPGAWSRNDYLLDEGITASASLPAAQIVRTGSQGFVPGCILSNLRHGAASRLMGLPATMHALPDGMRIAPDDAVMLAAMVTGDRTYLRHSLRVGFERTGSFHMLVVSGFHLAVLAACIHWLMRRLRLGRVASMLATLALTLGYALFTGFGVPIERAFSMVTLYMLGRLIYRERSALNAMGFAALCLLTANPASLFDASLQMTLLAVAAIGGIAAPLLAATIHPYVVAAREVDLEAIEHKLDPRIVQFRILLRMFAAPLEALGGRWLAWVAMPWTVRLALRAVELFIVSAIVELAMTLPMDLYFHRITLFALPVNMLMLPLLFLLLPAALVTLIALALWPTAAIVPGAVTAVALHVGVTMVRVFGSIRLGDMRMPEPLLVQQVAFYALIAAAVAMARYSLATNLRFPRWLSAAAVALAALIVFAPRPIDHPPNGLLVEAIDVGQGDSILLITPDGKTMLMDAGGFGGGPRPAESEFDIGEEVVAPALWARGIRRLDVVALSHAHSDHMGGMPAILRDFEPRELWVGNNPLVADYRALLEEAASLKIPVRSLRQSDELALGADHVRVLAPFHDYQPGLEPTNNDSLVLQVANGGTSVLLEGDAEAPLEEAMLREAHLESTLLKVGHHGSKTSSKPEFVARVRPSAAVISCGLRNHYGHPSPETLYTLEQMHIPTFSTDLEGASCFVLDGHAVRANVGCGNHP